MTFRLNKIDSRLCPEFIEQVRFLLGAGAVPPSLPVRTALLVGVIIAKPEIGDLVKVADWHDSLLLD